MTEATDIKGGPSNDYIFDGQHPVSYKVSAKVRKRPKQCTAPKQGGNAVKTIQLRNKSKTTLAKGGPQC